MSALQTVDVNVRSVHAAQGMGQRGLHHFCASMDLPPPITTNSYNDILKDLTNDSVQLTETLMQEAGERLFKIIKDAEPNKIKHTIYGEVADTEVTVDGTWQHRGYNSKIGVVLVKYTVTHY